jgi:hypothetical protein
VKAGAILASIVFVRLQIGRPASWSQAVGAWIMELSPLILLRPAREASRLTLLNVDNPQSLAGEIMNRSQRGAASV